jgi:hypothetical protein
MPKHAKLINPYAADQRVIGAAVQFITVYLPTLSFRGLAGIVVRRVNAVR